MGSGFALVMGVCLTGTPSAHAALVEYQIQNGTQGNFGFSDLHDAASGVVDVGTTRYWASGAILSNSFSGSLFGDQQIVGTTVTLTGINGTVVGTNGLTMTFTGGTSTGDTATDFTGGGSMTVNLSGPVSRTETFYFHPIQFTSPAPGANTFDGLLFGLWGNNWNNGVVPTPVKTDAGTFASNRLGIDLKGTIVSNRLQHLSLRRRSCLGAVCSASLAPCGERSVSPNICSKA